MLGGVAALAGAGRRPVLVVLVAALLVPGLSLGLFDSAPGVEPGKATLVAPSASSETPGEPEVKAGPDLVPVLAAPGGAPFELPRPSRSRLAAADADGRSEEAVLPVVFPPPRPA